MEKFEGYETRVKKIIEIKETLRNMRGVKTSDRSKNVFARPNGPRENAESAISGTGPGPTRKKRYTSSREEEEEEEDAQMCPCGNRVELTWWEYVKYTRGNGMY